MPYVITPILQMRAWRRAGREGHPLAGCRVPDLGAPPPPPMSSFLLPLLHGGQDTPQVKLCLGGRGSATVCPPPAPRAPHPQWNLLSSHIRPGSLLSSRPLPAAPEHRPWLLGGGQTRDPRPVWGILKLTPKGPSGTEARGTGLSPGRASPPSSTAQLSAAPNSWSLMCHRSVSRGQCACSQGGPGSPASPWGGHGCGHCPVPGQPAWGGIQAFLSPSRGLASRDQAFDLHTEVCPVPRRDTHVKVAAQSPASPLRPR